MKWMKAGGHRCLESSFFPNAPGVADTAVVQSRETCGGWSCCTAAHNSLGEPVTTLNVRET